MAQRSLNQAHSAKEEKCRNQNKNNAETPIIQKRMVRGISDDVTKTNSKLIKELSFHKKLENAWYYIYNGSVYANYKLI